MSIHPVDIHVGQRLRMKRSILGINQKDLGQMVGVTFQQIQKYERGVNRIGASEFTHKENVTFIKVYSAIKNQQIKRSLMTILKQLAKN